MDFNEYFAECLVRDRRIETRADAARRTVLEALALPRRPMRVALGVALMRIAQRMLGTGSEHVRSLDLLRSHDTPATCWPDESDER